MMTPHSPGREAFAINEQDFRILPNSRFHYLIAERCGRVHQDAFYLVNRNVLFLLLITDLVSPAFDPDGGAAFVKNDLCEDFWILVE